MAENRWAQMSGFKVAIPTAVLSLIGGVIAIFVWPSGIHAAPVWRFLVGYCLCSFALFLIFFPIAAFLQLRTPRDGSRNPRRQAKPRT